MSDDRLYEVELWSSSGKRVADISTMARNLQFSLERNAAESITFTMDLNEFERFCINTLNSDPEVVLWEGRTDVKLKRNGSYLLGTWIMGANTTAGADSQSINVTATGYLNLFRDRYITKTYTSTESTSIARDLITTSQSLDGSVGVTLASSPYLTGVLRDRTYSLDSVKDKLVSLTGLIDGQFDFAFTWDKQLQFYQQLGAYRSDISLVYGGEGSNIQTFIGNKDATQLFNKIIALGSGFGPEQLTSTVSDSDSALNYYSRTKIAQFNSVVQQATLDQNAAATLAKYKQPLRIPQVTVTGREMASGFINIGDRIPLTISGHPFLASFNGLYRVDRLDVHVNDDGFEDQVMIYFDDLGVDQDESAD